MELKTNINKATGKIHYTLNFETWFLISFNPLHLMFYRKATDEEYLKFRFRYTLNIVELFTPIVAAHLVMGDGSFLKESGRIKIATHSFSLGGVIRLQQAFQAKLNIKSVFYKEGVSKRTGKLQYVLYFTRIELQKLIPLMKPYMYYKLGF